jgi:hypothetical protein
MASDDTAALVVAMSAQLTKFEQDMNKAGGIADNAVRKIENRFSKMNIGRGIDDLVSSISRLAAVGGLAAVTASLHSLVSEVAKIGDVSQTVGLTAEQLQGLRFAFVQSGASADQADSGMERFARAMSEAERGAGDLYKILQANHVAISGLTVGEQFTKFAQLVRNAKSPQDALNLSIQAFGRNAGRAFLQVIQETSGSFNEFVANARAAGVVIDQEFIDRAKKVEAQWGVTWLKLKTPVLEFATLLTDTIGHGLDVLVDDAKQAVAAIWAAFSHPIDADAFTKKLDENLKTLGAGKYNTALNPPPGVTSITVNGKGNGTTIIPNAQQESFDKIIQSQERRIQLLGAEQQSVGQSAGYEAELKTRIDLTNAAISQNIPRTAERIAKIEEEAQKTGAAAQALDDYKRHWQGVQSAIQFGGDQIIDVMDGLRTGTMKASDAVRNLANAFIHATEQALILGSGPLAGPFGTASNVSGGTGGLLGALIGGFKGASGPTNIVGGAGSLAVPTFASGTNYAPGGMSLVGENGPELLNIPRGSQVIPNNVLSKMGGDGGPAITYSPIIDMRGASVEAVARLAQVIADDKRTFETRVKATVSSWRGNNPSALRA